MSLENKMDSTQLKRILETGKHLLVESDISKILQMAMDSIIDISKAERGLIILFEENGNIIFETARNLNRVDIENPKFAVSRTIIDKVKKEGISVFLKNALDNPDFKTSKSILRLKILSLIALPLTHNREIFGVVYLENRSVRGIFKQEAYDFVKEFADYISLVAFSALEKKRLQNRVDELEKELRKEHQLDAIIGHDPKMVKVLDLVTKIAGTNATVLIHGESGTGKELIARAIHFNSQRKDKKFLPVNCAALPENLLESELFGHVKGAFTGAIKEKQGMFEYAVGGTIFLDEISEMSLGMQAKLLRVLQSGEYSKVGSAEVEQGDVRIVAASSKDIKEMVDIEKFREDLYYRLNVIHLDLPPLRERKSDIPVLVEHFLQIYQEKYHKENLQLSQEAERFLLHYPFPGNIRELENMMQRAVILTRGEFIQPESFIEDIHDETDEIKRLTDFKTAKEASIEKFEKDYIIDCLKATKGNISKAAEIANLHVTNMHAKIKKYGIVPALFKQ